MATNLLALSQHVMDMGEQGRKRGTEMRLNRLAGQAFGAAPEQRTGILQQMVETDPQTGLAMQDRFQQQDDRRSSRLAGAAQYLLNAWNTPGPDGQRNEAAIQGAYRAVKPEFEAMANGTPLPETVDDSILPMLHQVIAAARQPGVGGSTAEQQNFDAMTAGFSPEERARARRIQAGLDPRSGVTTLQTPEGYVVFDRQRREAQPLYYSDEGIGAPVGHTPGQPMANGRPGAAGREVPRGPSVQGHADVVANAAEQMRRAGMPTEQIDAWVAQVTGGQEWDDVPAVTEPRRRVAAGTAAQSESNARAARAEGRAIEDRAMRSSHPMSAEEVAARGLRPGTVAEVDGFGNVTVLQQPSTATDKPATESERSAAGYLQRMENAEAELDALAAGGYDPTNVRDHYTAGQGVALNWMATDRGQHNRQQQEDWVRAKLRRESGAVIGADEMAREIQTYFPQPGDSRAVIDSKRRSRQRALQQMRTMGGRAISPARLAPSSDDPLGIL